MENEEPQYEFVTKIRCYACNGAEEAKDATPEVMHKISGTRALIRLLKRVSLVERHC